MGNNWYLQVSQKVSEARTIYNSLKKEPYTTEAIDKMEECRAIIGVWGNELRRLESAR